MSALALAGLMLAALIVTMLGLGILNNARTAPLLIVGLLVTMAGVVTMVVAALAPFL